MQERYRRKTKYVKQNNAETSIWKRKTMMQKKDFLFFSSGKNCYLRFKTQSVQRNDAKNPIWQRNKKMQCKIKRLFSFQAKKFFVLPRSENKITIVEAKRKFELSKKISMFFSLERSKMNRNGFRFASQSKKKQQNQFFSLERSKMNWNWIPFLFI